MFKQLELDFGVTSIYEISNYFYKKLKDKKVEGKNYD